MHNGKVQPDLVMDLFAEKTRSNKRIYMLDGCFQQAAVPPPLWRALVGHATCEAMRPCAGSAVKSE